MRSSTSRTAAADESSSCQPSGVSLDGNARPCGASAGLLTNPRSWSLRRTPFIDCRVTKAPRASSAFDKSGSRPGSSKHAYCGTVSPSGRSAESIAVRNAVAACSRT